MDDYWEVVDSNAAIATLLSACDPELLKPPLNVVRLCLHEGGLAPQIDNLDQWAGHLYHQVIRRAERTCDPRHYDLASEIVALRGEVPRPGPPTGPVLTLRLRAGDRILRLFSTAAQLTTPADAALEGLLLETFLPADEATREFFLR
jgi:hypothetical protein